MRIVTCGDWKGSMCVEGNWMENPDGDRNYTYNTITEEDEVEIVLWLRPGKTNMIIDVKDGRAGRNRDKYCEALVGKEEVKDEKYKRKKAVISILQVLAENELTAEEIQCVLSAVDTAFKLRPLSLEYVQGFKRTEEFKNVCAIHLI